MIDYDEILHNFAQIGGITVEELKSKSRKQKATICRSCYYLWLFKNTRLPISEIGRHVNRTHATIMSGIKYVGWLFETNDVLIEPYKEILNKK